LNSWEEDLAVQRQRSEKWDKSYVRLREILKTSDPNNAEILQDLDAMKYKILFLIGECCHYRFSLEDERAKNKNE